MVGRHGRVTGWGWGGTGTGEAAIANLKPHHAPCEIPQPMKYTWVNGGSYRTNLSNAINPDGSYGETFPCTGILDWHFIHV